MNENTLIILKPDCMEKNLMPEVLDRFFKAGLKLSACKMSNLKKEILAEHYAHILGKPYYPPLEEFMMRTPVMLVVLSGENAVAKARKILGPTNSLEAPAGTIRGDFGTNNRENIAHASDSAENAKIEIERFFDSCEVF